ncbi:sigma-54-dependent Fis family transcriptional regulator [Clostridium sp. CF012]|uniref:sigma-54 interaction domain-containing protein n=1 Tax=Clostridium sp. CF012 TaxID=2843319 RepID=UPI001C0B8ECE|nr:sigma 54-interacting transcriptional regulator [Clostridium sp. CF012]MBU3145367.1 sigma 54-interacting transcriptional regulator [Clostridium sp. CF012]
MSSFIDTKEFIQFCHEAFDKVPIAVDFLDKEGRIIYINKTFSEFLQIPVEKIINKLITDVDYTSKFLKSLSEKKADIAMRHKFANGKEAIVHRIPLLNNNGELIGGLGMVLFEEIQQMKEVLDKCELLDKQLKLYKNEIAKFNTTRYNLSDIIGSSSSINECKNQIKKFAKVNMNVLITGESGVGKELVAHSLHNESNRKDKLFVSINCSAIPENLLEAELFGYEDGAFTGAKKGGNIGKFEIAQGGTIFLDEIGDMPYYMQAKLLRVLQEKEIVKVGGKRPIAVDTTVVCASNKDLPALIGEGTFREDLYYRLNVLTVDIPPLRSRIEDIPVLVETFLSTFYKENGLYRKIPNNIMQLLMGYTWPGNVRELKNVIDKMCVNSEETNITIQDFPKYIINHSLRSNVERKDEGLHEFMQSIEKEIIKNVLEECKYNKSLVAKRLKIPRITLYRKIKEYHLEE